MIVIVVKLPNIQEDPFPEYNSMLFALFYRKAMTMGMSLMTSSTSCLRL